MKTDLTVEILKDIRTSIRVLEGTSKETNKRIDATNERLDASNERLDALREELSRRIVESEIRTSTAITELAGSVREVATLLREQHDLRPRVERCESEIAEMKKRLPAA